MKKNLFMSAVALLLLSGCDYNEENFKGLDEMTQLKNVMNLDYTLTDADYDAIGDFAKTNKYLLSLDQADAYFPKWLLKNFYTADPTSVVRVKYNGVVSNPHTPVKYVALDKNEDYAPAYGPDRYAPFLNASTETDANLIASLKAKGDALASPKVGNVVMMGYNYNANMPIQNGTSPVFSYDFEDITKTGDVTSIAGGWFLSAPSACTWKVYSDRTTGNKYAQFSANKTTEETTGWLITPAIAIEGSDKKFAFDVAVSYWNANCLSVLISTDFNGKKPNDATWVDQTSEFSMSSNTSMKSAGTISLSEYAGKKIYIAFKYVGDGTRAKTTTYQIDNMMVGKDIVKLVTGSISKYKVYKCKVDGEWTAIAATDWSEAIYYMTSADYDLFGLKNMRFSDSDRAEDYLPTKLNKDTYLGATIPKDGTIKTIVYRYYSSELKMTDARATILKYSSLEGCWKWQGVQPVIRPYAFDGTKWIFDPSITVALKAKGDKPTADFYQAITNWVKANKGAEYVTSFGNNDYYYGGSAYNNNFDFRPASWKGQNGVAYGGMSDEELKTLMYSRLQEAFIPGLEATYPNAEPVESVNVIYTIDFLVSDNVGTTSWTIKYEVTAKAKFTYVENSLKEVK